MKTFIYNMIASIIITFIVGVVFTYFSDFQNSDVRDRFFYIFMGVGVCFSLFMNIDFAIKNNKENGKYKSN